MNLFAQTDTAQPAAPSSAPATPEAAPSATPSATTEEQPAIVPRTQVPAKNPADTPKTQGSGGLDFLMFLLPAVLIFYWFFILRPQQKQQDQQKKTLDSLDKNDKVLTVGGIIGTVHSVDKEKNEIVLKVDDSSNAKIRFSLAAIQAVFPKEEGKS
jgi:preprotein translocase subunit YajC